MSWIFDRDTDEIQRVGEALRVRQQFRDPRAANISIGGQNALTTSFGPNGTSQVNVRDIPGYNTGINNLQQANTAANDRFGTLIGGLQSNQNPFIQARVRPFEEQAAEQVAGVQRSVGQRNIQGSLGNREIRNEQIRQEQGLSDQRALATQDSLATQLAAEAGRMNLGQEQLGIADAQLRGEFQNIQNAMEALQLGLSDQQQLTDQLTSPGSIGQTPIDSAGDIMALLRDLGILTGTV